MKNIVIIYHDADFDGKLSNEVCRYHLKRIHPEAAIHSYGWDYGRATPMLIGFDQIYIVDLSVDELMARHDLQGKIVWIDHHKTAIEKWKEVQFSGYCIDGVAACRLCWQWFTWNATDPAQQLATKREFIDRRVNEPELIRLAGEYDIWDHRDPDAKALQFGLRSLNATEFADLVEKQFSNSGSEFDRGMAFIAIRTAVKNGHAIKSYCDKQNDEYSATYSRTLDWEGLRFCCLNIGQRGNSDLARGGLKPEDQAIFAWRHTGDGVMVSLYHAPGHEDLDLSAIAKRYGGGGHRGACGFRLTLKQLAEILQ